MRGAPVPAASRARAHVRVRGSLVAVVVQLLASLAVLLWGARAHAATERSVDIVIADGDEASAARLTEVLRDPLRRLQVEAHFGRARQVEPRQIIEPQPGAAPRLARVWIDLGRRERATLYLVDGTWERILVRHVALSAGLDEVAREELSLILRAALEGLMSGERIGVGREEARKVLAPDAPRPAPKPAPPPRDGGPAFELGLAYEGQLFAPQHTIAHGPLASLGLRSGGSIAIGGTLSGQLRLPVSVDGQRAGLELGTWALRAMATLRIPVATRLALRGALGGGADVVDIDPRVREGAGARTAEARYEASAVGRALAGVEWTVFGETALSLGISCEGDFVAQRYVDVHAGESVEVLAPYRVRPGLVLGIGTGATLAGAPGPAVR